MKNITLCKPVVLRSRLNDMSLSQRKTTLALLSNHKVLVPGRDGLKFVEPGQKNSHFPQFCLYGSEAVCYYRQSLGLADVSIKDIDVNGIIMEAEDFDALFGLLIRLNNIRMRNERFAKLWAMDVPAIILRNEYRMLQEYIEALHDNSWCGHPVANRCMPCGGRVEKTRNGKNTPYPTKRKNK